MTEKNFYAALYLISAKHSFVLRSEKIILKGTRNRDKKMILPRDFTPEKRLLPKINTPENNFYVAYQKKDMRRLMSI